MREVVCGYDSVPQRGFTLLVAVILSSVILALALALLDVAYKQVTLALSSKQSQYAFSNADTALECVLYWDQKFDAFNHATPMSGGSISCGGLTVTGYTSPNPANSGVPRRTDFSLPCATGGVAANVTIMKSSDATTVIYANGYNVCDSTDTRRIERGLRAVY